MYVGPHVGSVVDLLLTAPVPRAPRRGEGSSAGYDGRVAGVRLSRRVARPAIR